MTAYERVTKLNKQEKTITCSKKRKLDGLFCLEKLGFREEGVSTGFAMGIHLSKMDCLTLPLE